MDNYAKESPSLKAVRVLAEGTAENAVTRWGEAVAWGAVKRNYTQHLGQILYNHGARTATDVTPDLLRTAVTPAAQAAVIGTRALTVAQKLSPIGGKIAGGLFVGTAFDLFQMWRDHRRNGTAYTKQDVVNKLRGSVVSNGAGVAASAATTAALTALGVSLGPITVTLAGSTASVFVAAKVKQLFTED